MPDRLRVLQIAAMPFPSHQGSQVHVAGTCRALARRGHDVVLACLPGAGRPAGLDGVRVVAAPALPGAAATLRSGPHPVRAPLDLLLAGTVRRLLRQPFDVIHAHNVEAPVIARLARRRGPPLVYDLHTLMAEELPTYLGGARLAGAVGGVVDRLVPRLCDGAIALSDRAAAWLRARAPRVATIPPGVDPAELRGDRARARARWRLEGPVVVYAGNTDGYQDLDDLLAAMTRVDAALLVVTGASVAALHARADAAGLPAHRRRFVHSRDLADTADALAAADVGCVPRRRCAGFPIKLLNQLAVGLPTVAVEGAAPPIPGVVPCPAGEVALAAAIRSLLADPDRRRALSAAGRAAVARDWSWEARAVALERFYAALGTRSRRG